MDRNSTETDSKAVAPQSPEVTETPFRAHGDATEANGAVPQPVIRAIDEAIDPTGDEAFDADGGPVAGAQPGCRLQVEGVLCGAGRDPAEPSRCTAGHPMCKCGAPPHPDPEKAHRRCANEHPYAGLGHELSTKHGRYSTRETERDAVADLDDEHAAGIASMRWKLIRKIFAGLIRRAMKLYEGVDTLSQREVQALLGMLERLKVLDVELRELEPRSRSERWDGLAQLCARHPEEITKLFVVMLDADPAVAGVMRTALAMKDATVRPDGDATAITPWTSTPNVEGLPRLRRADPNADADDVVFL
ncbi:MAG: hypothetical protein K2Y23_08935 [Cyanobacteria bacterium]|nr:hypothetical protein [Cyanobacteriota bacterium]